MVGQSPMASFPVAQNPPAYTLQLRPMIKSVIMLASGHIGGTCPAHAPDECRYLIVCLGGVRMPTWKQEPPSGRHVVSVGNG